MAGSDPIYISIPGLDPTMIESFTAAFHRFDTNGNGSLDKKEFRAFLKAAGKDKMSPYMFEVIDTDHSKTVSLAEFLQWGQALWDVAQARDMRRWLKMVFDACDSNKQGKLTQKEFLKFMKYCGAPVGFFARKKTFKAFDADGNGLVEFEEIMATINYT
jgi:Ca2+-binding EF-hand superfamily protein